MIFHFWVWVSFLLIILYVGLILFYRYHWNRIQEIDLEEVEVQSVFISILIVGRNESSNIEQCITSILANDFPVDNYEILFIDDHSEDNTVEILNSLSSSQLKILHLKDYPGLNPLSYKKSAIEFAHQFARGELILHTDADTLVGPGWIRSHMACYLNFNSAFCAAPVFIQKAGGFLNHFQVLDFLTTMGVTGAGIQSGFHFLANGANMSYDKRIRSELDLERSDNLASGDDVFFIHEVAKMDDTNIHFIKNQDAIVYTFAEQTWFSFFHQRFRWAGKSHAYRDHNLQIVQALVFLVNMVILLNLVLLISGMVPWWLFFLPLFSKLMVDYWFVGTIAREYSIDFQFLQFIGPFVFYPFYFILVGFSSILPIKPVWKGRRIK